MRMPLKDVCWYAVASLLLLGVVPVLMALAANLWPCTFLPEHVISTVIGGLTSAVGLIFIFESIRVLWTKGRGCAGVLGRFRVQTPTSRLVTEGPYAVCRNPMHFGLILFYLGVCSALNAFFCLVVPLATWGLAYLLAVMVDEPRLKADFKAEYEAYCAKVPRFWPRNITKNT